MNAHVDRSLCENHGQCAIAAPDVFSMDDDGVLVFDAARVAEYEADVEDAADVCPAQAILISTDQ